MSGRPCRPSADLKGIWQFLLPDTAFPACGTAEEAGTERGADVPRDDIKREPSIAADPSRSNPD